MRTSLLALSLLAVGSMAIAQKGHYITTVANSGKGRMFDVDPSTRKAVEFKIPAAISTDSVNTITMQTSSLGYVGTIGKSQSATVKGVPANIYRILVNWSTHTITATKLNTKPLGGYNLAQIAQVGGLLYFVTSDFSLTGTAGNTEGILYSLPIGGGVPTQLAKINATSVKGWVTGRSTNACASDGKTVYIAAWWTGEVVAYDIAKKTTSFWGKLPAGKINALPYPVAMHIDGNNLVVGSLFGDITMVDKTTKKLVKQLSAKTADTLSPWSPYKNSICENTDTDDWVFGSRDGAIDPVADIGQGQMARRQTLLVDPAKNTMNQFSINGIWYFPSGGGASSYDPYMAGCSSAAIGNFVPTSGGGILAKGSKSFSFLLDGAPPKSIGLLILGAAKASIPVGCGKLGVIPIMVLPVVAKPSDAARATQNGTWRATLGPLMLPNKNTTVLSQWAMLQGTNLYMSDARALVLK